MAVIGGDGRRVDGLCLKSATVSVDEVVEGDWAVDEGILKRVRCVEPLVSRGLVLMHFDAVEGYDDSVSVPVSELVSVWRVSGAR